MSLRRLPLTEALVMLVTVLQWLVLSTLVGLVVGTGAGLFLLALFYSMDQTALAPGWLAVLLLPLGGLLNGLLMFYGYQLGNSGLKDSVIEAVHRQSGKMPFTTVAIKPMAAIITLASGGSAGKEGPCSHIGASLASAIGHMFRLNDEMQKRLVACGVSAGFAAVFGTPLAGAIYGVEVLAIGRIRHDFLFPAIVAGIVSFQVSQWWGVPYVFYYMLDVPVFSQMLFLKTVLLGLFCGAVAWLFIDLTIAIQRNFARLRARFDLWPPLMPVMGGLVLAGMLIIVGRDYLGLSLPLLERALAGEAMSMLGFFWKILAVAITLGSGFYAGIATPQLVIGAVAGNAFAPLLGIPPSLGAAIGLVSVVAAASNTPIAAILMGVELFGGSLGVTYVAGSGIAAYLMVGHRSVYPAQLVAYPKSSWMHVRPDMPLGQEKIYLSYSLLRWLHRLRSRRHGRR